METVVSFKVTVCGIEELPAHCKAGVGHVVSMLDPNWPVPTALSDYGAHEHIELRSDDVIDPVPDRVTPEPPDIRRLVALGSRLMGEPTTWRVLIHCGAGFSRSPAAVAVLLAQTMPTLPPGDIAGEVL